MSSLPAPPSTLEFVGAMIASYARLLAEPLVPANVPTDEAAAWLYASADFSLLAHDTSEDPRFIYVNRQAQRCFERSWDELVGMPSRLSAEAPNRAERAAMLAAVVRDGFTRDYRGLRIARSGRRFWIERGTIWNVQGPAGELWGQAARFRETRPMSAE